MHRHARFRRLAIKHTDVVFVSRYPLNFLIVARPTGKAVFGLGVFYCCLAAPIKKADSESTIGPNWYRQLGGELWNGFFVIAWSDIPMISVSISTSGIVATTFLDLFLLLRSFHSFWFAAGGTSQLTHRFSFPVLQSACWSQRPTVEMLRFHAFGSGPVTLDKVIKCETGIGRSVITEHSCLVWHAIRSSLK